MDQLTIPSRGAQVAKMIGEDASWIDESPRDLRLDFSVILDDHELDGLLNGEWTNLSDDLVAKTPVPSSKLQLPAKRLKQPPSRSSKKRITCKEKIELARQEVDELSEILSELIQASKYAGQGPRLANGTSCWERVAVSQLRLRRQTEEKNAKLRDLVGSYRRMNKNIKRVLRRRIDEELCWSPPVNISDANRIDNEMIFQQLMGGMHQLHIDAKTKYPSQAQPTMLESPIRRCQEYPEAIGGVFAEFVYLRQVPFTVQQTVNAVWKYLLERPLLDEQYLHAKELQQTKDTMTRYVNFLCINSELTSSIRERSAVRKYAEEDYIMLVIQTLADPVAKHPGLVKTPQAQEIMPIVVRRGSAMASGQETAIIDMRVSTSRNVDTNDNAAVKLYRQTYRAALSIWEQKLAHDSQEIENLLFDEAAATNCGL